MRCGAQPATSCSPSRTRPYRGGVNPMIERSVVVLPTPLRPSMTAMRPGGTSRREERASDCGGSDSELPVHSILLAEQAARPDYQDDQHQEVHKGQREILEVVRAEH